MSNPLHKRKFLGLSSEKQHKICAETLKSAYLKLLNGQDFSSEAEDYQQLCTWMSTAPQEILQNAQNISNLYHFHLKRADISLREHDFLPHVRKGDKVDKNPEFLPHTIYLDHLRSAHNVGSILRTVEAFALGEVFFSPMTPYIDHPQVVNTSMGCHQWVNCRQNVSIDLLPRPMIALETSHRAISLYEYTFPSIFSLVIGNEEYGCSDEVLETADVIIEIPLMGRKNSLNAANAFAIAAAEIRRQTKNGMMI